MHIEEFKDVNQVAPHASEHEKHGLIIDHPTGDFRKAILEMSMNLTKYVCLEDIFEGCRPLHRQTACLYMSTTLSAADVCWLVFRANRIHQRSKQHYWLHWETSILIRWASKIIRWDIWLEISWACPINYLWKLAWAKPTRPSSMTALVSMQNKSQLLQQSLDS